LNYTRMAVPSFSLEIITHFYTICQYHFEEVSRFSFLRRLNEARLISASAAA